MKSFFILISIIQLLFVFNMQGYAQNETKYWNTIIFESYSSENQSILSEGPVLFNHLAGIENGQRSLQHLFPTVQRFFYSGLKLNENAELNRKNEISTYVFYSESHIPRLEGVGIIHPFNYFW